MILNKIIKPKSLKLGATAGIFTSSSPAHIWFKEKYFHALEQLKTNGFEIYEGHLTRQFISQGYRTAPPKERAQEFMELIENPKVDFLIATIGGYNSSSLLPYLNFEKIAEAKKIISGYSDITSLHMGILTQANLSTFYGPAVIPTFGEWPEGFSDSIASFKNLSSESKLNNYKIKPFKYWSNHFRNALNLEWKTGERKYNSNNGGKILNNGYAEAPIIIANLNTLCALAGTKYFPDLKGKILLIEEEQAPFPEEERSLTHLKFLGVFDKIVGLIIGKPEVLENKNAPFTYEDLILEIVGKRNYPIISQFDCGHTHPSHTLAQMLNVKIEAENENFNFEILEAAVCD
ncbi:LD-carboxypeptidase [Pigmentibacter sp. JX0631]|uniref:S66 family peptidase n=1 Tax=Pigmentibacter sp. JX0631 TaxID=2976982 RepID=UPI0024697301|nr:LD-carboxypeptidase [Pigmentibacter sp. JX0631]WGL59182.1 LD-carboxypeptidase [Pigmentibacter sp. JX0631]